MQKVEYEILLCKRCNGSGVVDIPHFDVEKFDLADERIEKRVCRYCNGSGRQLKTITTTLEPYENEDLPTAVFNEIKNED
jgi:DnaJ-class molecular chaperone